MIKLQNQVDAADLTDNPKRVCQISCHLSLGD